VVSEVGEVAGAGAGAGEGEKGSTVPRVANVCASCAFLSSVFCLLGIGLSRWLVPTHSFTPFSKVASTYARSLAWDEFVKGVLVTAGEKRKGEGYPGVTVKKGQGQGQGHGEGGGETHPGGGSWRR